MVDSVYCDGGVIRKNPSSIGGTWAYIWLDEMGEEYNRGSGVITPAEAGLEAITNNYTELLAAIQAMTGLPDGWDGRVYTDSKVTLCRITLSKTGWAGVPDPMREQVREMRKRLGKYEVILLDGHPNRAHLASGKGKRGNPCSKWNVECDRMCGVEAEKFLASNQTLLSAP